MLSFSRSLSAFSALVLLAVSAPAGAVQTPPALRGRPVVEVHRGDPVRLGAELDWHHVPAAHQAAWQRLVAEMGPQTWAVWDRDTRVVRRIWGAGVHATGSTGSPAAAERFAREFLARHVQLLAPGASASDFELVADIDSGGIRTIGFVQRAGGLPVEGGQVSFRFRRDRLFMIGSEALPHVPRPAARVIGDDAAGEAALAWVRRDLAADARITGVLAPRIVPLIRAGRVDYATVVPIEVSAESPRGRWLVHVDAATGEPVARVQTLRFASGTLNYNAPVRQPGKARQDFPANQASLTIDGANGTSSAAGVVMWNTNNPAALTARVTGAQIKVGNDAGVAATTNLNLGPGQTVAWNAAADQLVDAQVTTFVHGNLAIDYARTIDPQQPYFAEQLQARVNINDSCNAYYDGQSINFFRQSQQCNNTGRVADIVYHEFGHGVHDHAVIQGVGAFDPALSEGVSDYLAATITEDPAMGGGFFLADDGPLRHIDPQGSEAVWPDDIAGDPHTTGLIIGGALWDLRKALVEKLGPAGVVAADRLYYQSIRRAVDIPTMYFEALAADDDDGDLANGTPNECLINEAFRRHGLYKIGVDVAAPGVAAPQLAGYEVSAALMGGGNCPGSGITSADLVWRLREQPAVGGVVAMDIAADALTGAIPQQPAGSVVQYQLQIGFEDGSTIAYPDNRADPFYELFVGAVEPIYCTDFEVDPAADGWTHGLASGEPGEGADDWMWGPPMAPPSSGDPQAAYDGATVFGNDLGGGNYNGLYQPEKVNFARSPVLDTTGYAQVRLQYRRWLNVEDGFFDRASIYANDQVAWQNLRTPDEPNASVHHSDREWRFHDVDLTPMVAADAVQLRFELKSDGGLEMGGWTLDALCVVGVVDAPPGACGDGIVGPGEQCDDGPDNSDTAPDACRTDCTSPTCGDGVVDAGEQCDDGNLAGGDGCDPTCKDAGEDPPTTGEPDPTGGPTGATGGETGEAGEAPDTDSAGGTGGASDESGCGCRQDDPRGAASLLLGLALLGLGRRRSRAR